MTRLLEYDLKIGGVPYLLAASPGGVGGRSIRFGKIQTEPGPLGEMGTIQIPSFHHGFGQTVARDMRGVYRSLDVDLSTPGVAILGGVRATVWTSTETDEFYDGQGGGIAKFRYLGVPTNEEYLFFITARRIHQVVPSTGARTEVHELDSTKYAFTGSWCQYKGSLYFGVESNQDGSARGYWGNRLIRYEIATAIWSVVDWCRSSRVHAAKGKFWWVENQGLLGTPQVYWTDDPTFPGEGLCSTVVYTGNGGTQTITGFPFTPDVVIVKAKDLGDEAALKTDTMAAGESRLWNTAGQIATGITGFLSGGFSVGGHASVNANGVEYVAVGFKKKAGLIDTLSYDGTGVDNRDVTTTFSPDLVFVAKGAVGTGDGHVATRPSTLSGDNTFLLGVASGPVANIIQSLGANLFQVGTDVRANENAIPYHAVIFKEASPVVSLQTYVGDSQDNRDISVGWEGYYAIVKHDTGLQGVQRMAAKGGDWSSRFASAGGSNLIQALGATVVQVGSGSDVNASYHTLHMMVFGASTSFNKAGPFPLESGGYCTERASLGHYMMTCKYDGQVYGIDEQGISVGILGPGMASPGLNFGKGATQFMGNMLVPHDGGLIALSLSDFAAADIHPLKVNEAIAPADFPSAVRSLAVAGYRLLVGMWSSGKASHMTLLQPYSDGEYFTLMHQIEAATWALRASVAVDYAGYHQIYSLLGGDGTTIKISRGGLAAPGWVTKPGVQAGSGEIYTPMYSGEGLAGPVTKLFLQVRGVVAGVNGANYLAIAAGVDLLPPEGGVALGASIQASGPFVRSFPESSASLGRTAYLYLWFHGEAGGATFPRLEMPLFIDFMYFPSVEDRLTLGVLASDAPQDNLGTPWARYNGTEVQAALWALRGTVTTVELPGQAPWNVLVEDIEVVEIEAPDPRLSSPGRMVKMQIRRL